MSSPRTAVLILVPTATEAEGVFGRSPSGMDALLLPELGADVRLALTGFGLAAAGPLAATHVHRTSPERCLLVGLGGTLDVDRAPLESVVAADRIYCDGIGVGEGDDHLDASRLGFWPAPGLVGHSITLKPQKTHHWRTSDVLTVAAGSDSVEQAHRRFHRYPTCVVEDMETWSVALACRAVNVPLLALRGICNTAGNRDKRHWRLEGAFAALRAAISSALEEEPNACRQRECESE